MFALPALGEGGPDKVFGLFASGLAQRGWAVDVAVCESSAETAAVLAKGIDIVEIPTWGPRVLRRHPFPGLARVVRQRSPDVLVATLQMIATAGLARYVFPSRTKVVMRPANHYPSVSRELGHRSQRYRIAERFERIAIRGANGVIAQSPAIADSVRDWDFRGLLSIVGNPVAPHPDSGFAPRLAGNPTVVAVGRLSAQKGFDLLLKALPAVVAEFPGLHLHLVGAGPDEDDLRSMASKWQLPVTFHGQRSDAVSLMAGADLVVAPSRYEGFSNVILEAQAVGTPVVATDCPGAAQEVLGFTGGGVVVPAENIDALVDGMRRVLEAPQRLDRAAVSAATLSNWSPSKVVDSLESFLREVLAE